MNRHTVHFHIPLVFTRQSLMLPPPPSPLPLCYLPLQARSSRDTGKSPSSLGLADFDLLRVIGRGSYAKVLLVQLKKTERIYAMKVVKKELVNDDEVKDTSVSRTRTRKRFWSLNKRTFMFLRIYCALLVTVFWFIDVEKAGTGSRWLKSLGLRF